MKPIEHGRALLTALTLLTRLPWQPRFQWTESAQRLSPAYYPLIGVGLGLLLGSAQWLLSGWPSGLAAFVILLLWVALTGALHLDGLADTVDGWFAGHRCEDPEARKARMLTVMRDPACGPMAVVALVLLLLGKWLALDVLLSSPAASNPWLWCLLLVLPRAALLPLLMGTPYARNRGLASGLSERPPLALWVSLVLSLILPFVFGAAWPVFLSIVWLLLLVGVWRRFWLERIGGYTGDTLGALVELSEWLLLWFWVAVALTEAA